MKYKAAYLIKAYTIRVAKMRSTEIPAPTNTISSKENGRKYHDSFSLAPVSTGFLTFYTKETKKQQINKLIPSANTFFAALEAFSVPVYKYHGRIWN